MKATSTKYDQQQLPHDEYTERAVIATLMRHYDKMAALSADIDESLFYGDIEREAYKAVAAVIESGQVPNVNALWAWAQAHESKLQRGDILEIWKMPSADTIRQDIMRLREMARRREAWRILMESARRSIDPMTPMDNIYTDTMTRLAEAQQAGNDGISTLSESLDELRSVVMENRDGKRTALPTGFPLFDDKFLLRPGTLTVLAAFTSVGKTALALNIAKNVSGSSFPVAYYSLEMGRAELAARIIAEDMQTTSTVILNKKMGDVMLADFEKAVEVNRRRPLYIDERSTLSFDHTLRSIRTMARTKEVRLVIIDYLQIYTQTTENVEAALAAMARQAKNIAMETKTAVILLSQLNRSDDKPSIKMLRGSGQIEESADNIVLIDRPAAYPDYKEHIKTKDGKVVGGNFDGIRADDLDSMACLILAKGRGVGTGHEFVTFRGDVTRFFPNTQPSWLQEQQDEPLPF